MSFTTRPELRGTFGMVASTHWLASAAGMAVLERGGNAFDAAVATGLTLQVVEPHLNGPGGDLPALLLASRPRSTGRAVRAGAFTAGGDDRPLPRRARAAPGSRHGTAGGGRAGRVRRLAAAVARLRHAAMRDVLSFAISYAEQGFPLVPRSQDDLRRRTLPRRMAKLGRGVRQPPTGSARSGTPALAETYRRVSRRRKPRRRTAGADRGRRRHLIQRVRPEAIDPFSSKRELDQTHRRTAPGAARAEGPRDWRPRYEEPLAVDYHGLTVLKAGPWSQAPVFLQTVAAARRIRPARAGTRNGAVRPRPDRSAKLAFADREAWYGDPDFADVPWRRCSPVNTRTSAASWSATSAPGNSARLARRPGAAAHARIDSSAELAEAAGSRRADTRRNEEGDTVHLDVVDRFGNMVAATPSGGWLWGAPVVPELGFCLGTRAQISGSRKDSPNSLDRASGRGRRFRRRWSHATASRTWRSGHRAATSRISGRSTRCSDTFISGSTCRRRSTRRTTTPRRSRVPSIHG